MTIIEQTKFREDFQSIKHQKDLLSKCNARIKRLPKTTIKDKMLAMAVCLKQKEHLESGLKLIMKGKSYGYWKQVDVEINHINRQLSKFNRRMEILKF